MELMQLFINKVGQNRLLCSSDWDEPRVEAVLGIVRSQPGLGRTSCKPQSFFMRLRQKQSCFVALCCTALFDQPA